MVVVAIAGAAAERDAMATQLIEALSDRGRRVAVIAASAGLAIDEPGKDSYAHAAAGARDVLVVSGQRWARVHRNEPPAAPDLARLSLLVEDADVVLALGFEEEGALAQGGGTPAFRLDKAEAIVDLIERLSEEPD